MNIYNKFVITPGFKTSTHDAMFDKLCTELKSNNLILSPLRKYTTIAIIIKSVYTLIFSLPSLINSLLKNDIRFYEYKGINLGKPINEESISRSNTGKFSFFNNGAYYFIKSHLVLNIVTKILDDYTIKLIIGGDGAYILFSILAQKAIKYNIPTYFIVGTTRITVNQFDLNYLSPSPEYEKLFKLNKSNISEKTLKIAERNLINRTQGDKSSLSYMPRNQIVEKFKHLYEKGLCLYLHDFFDSPGLYGGNLFSNHVEWVEVTIKYLKQKNIPLYIKIHPNEREESEVLRKQLFKKHENSFQIIDTDISLVDLKKTPIKAIITVYGTVSIEATYIGIPIISAGRSPFTCMQNIHKPRSIEAYFELLDLAYRGKLSIPSKEDVVMLEALNYINCWNLPKIDDISFDDITEHDWNNVLNLNYPDDVFVRRKYYLKNEKFHNYFINKYKRVNFIKNTDFKILIGAR